MIYVDDMYKTSIGNFRGMRMSHMIADDIKELHAFAARIGMKRSWFQESPSGDHYDVSLGLRKKAVTLGAHEITMRECAAICWCQRNKLFYSSPPAAVKQFLGHAMAIMHDKEVEYVSAAQAPNAASPTRKRLTRNGQRSDDRTRLPSPEPRMVAVVDEARWWETSWARPEANTSQSPDWLRAPT
jgi:hypothetical protein